MITFIDHSTMDYILDCVDSRRCFWGAQIENYNAQLETKISKLEKKEILLNIAFCQDKIKQIKKIQDKLYFGRKEAQKFLLSPDGEAYLKALKKDTKGNASK